MVFVFSALGVGLIISAVAPSLETANILGLLIAFLPAFLLWLRVSAGFHPDPVAVAQLCVSWPVHGDYHRGVFLKGAGFSELWPELAALTAYALVVLLASSLLYRRRST